MGAARGMATLCSADVRGEELVLGKPGHTEGSFFNRQLSTASTDAGDHLSMSDDVEGGSQTDTDNFLPSMDQPLQGLLDTAAVEEDPYFDHIVRSAACTISTASTASSSVSQPTERAVLLFDWDDTLLPTSHLKSLVKGRRFGNEGPMLPADSPIVGPLRHHGELIAATLQAARSLGRVAIVTLSTRPWVHASAAWFFPGFDFQMLLGDLDIQIYYAGEHAPSHIARLVQSPSGVGHMLQDGVDVLRACKRGAMSKCLRDICGRSRVRLNVVSVGDSATEQEAIKGLLWSPRPPQLPKSQHLCKTVKFMEGPTLQQLGDQLRLVASLLPHAVDCREDVDLTM